jgi:hypothetical protein
MFSGIKKFIFAKMVKKYWKEAQMGKLGSGAKKVWQFLDGWKLMIVTVVAILRQVYTLSDQTNSYIDAALAAIGWSNLHTLVDPGQFVLAIGAAVAISHKLYKAAKDSQAGVPVKDLLSGK